MKLILGWEIDKSVMLSWMGGSENCCGLANPNVSATDPYLSLGITDTWPCGSQLIRQMMNTQYYLDLVFMAK
jgi:hypothetical protein